jgi:hypothetical protein
MLVEIDLQIFLRLLHVSRFSFHCLSHDHETVWTFRHFSAPTDNSAILTLAGIKSRVSALCSWSHAFDSNVREEAKVCHWQHVVSNLFTLTSSLQVMQFLSLTRGYALQDLGSSEIFPTCIKHNANGRFVAVCGDGEYVVYTALAWRNKSFDEADDFAWSWEPNDFATRKASSSTITLHKNFKVRLSTVCSLNHAAAKSMEESLQLTAPHAYGYSTVTLFLICSSCTWLEQILNTRFSQYLKSMCDKIILHLFSITDITMSERPH